MLLSSWGPPGRVQSELSSDAPSPFQGGKYDGFSQQGGRGEMGFGEIKAARG